jgi:hypothetical protein
MSVAEAQTRISAREFAEWMAYYHRSPWGGERADYAAALICSTVANVSGRTKKQLKPEDFKPNYGPPKRQSIAEMKAILMRVSQNNEALLLQAAKQAEKKKGAIK